MLFSLGQIKTILVGQGKSSPLFAVLMKIFKSTGKRDAFQEQLSRKAIQDHMSLL